MTHPETPDAGEQRTVWYVLCELRNPSPEPFAVMSVDTTQHENGGVVSTVVSLHTMKEEAERIVHEFNNGKLS
jgi:hypothetical protein